MKNLYLLTMPKSDKSPVGFSRIGAFKTWREVNDAARSFRADKRTKDVVRVYSDAGDLLRPRLMA